MATLFLGGKFQAINASGVLPGAQLFTYAAGTLTPLATYTNQGGLTPNTNPVVCDASGQADVWVGAGAYRMILKTSTGVTVWDVDNLSQSTVSARTAVEIAASITPTTYDYPEGDIRRYGATTASGNNASAINAALLVSANGGSPAFIPAGTWTHTSTLNATLSSSMYGVGPASVLNPSSCDGLTFTNQPLYQGGRFFRNFSLSGTTTGAKAAIVGAMTAASGNRVTGVSFDRLNVQGFQYGANLQGFWNCTFRDCFFYNNYQGVQLTERNIKTTFVDCTIQKGTIAGTGSQYGALLDQVGGVRSEDIVFRGCFIYGWDYGVAVGNALYTVLEHCDLDNCQNTGVLVTTANGGTSIRDCWIDTTVAAASYGIDISALGAANYDKITIDGNNIVCTTANAGSIGIRVGGSQTVACTNNRVTGFATGLSNTGAPNLVAKWNSINATATAIAVTTSGSVDNEIGPNTIQAGTALTFSGATPAGFRYHSRGTFTLTLTGMAAGTTGTVSWIAHGGSVTLSVPAAGIAGTSNTTAMTGTGLPAALWPVTDQVAIPTTIDNSLATQSYVKIAAATGLMTFGKDANVSAFTATGTKGLSASNVTYSYL